MLTYYILGAFIQNNVHKKHWRYEMKFILYYNKSILVMALSS